MHIEDRLSSLESRVAALEARGAQRHAATVLPSWKTARKEVIEAARRAGWPHRIFPRDARIRLVVDHNPKRGTARLRFALIKPDMNVGEYLDAVAEA